MAGIVGRRAVAAAGFVRYSEAPRHADVTWNEKMLDAWITNPQQFIPNNIMTFPGIGNARQRADLIAFLKNPKMSAESAGGGPERNGRPGSERNEHRDK